MKRPLLLCHRYLSAALLVFWCLQILSGVALIYAREIDDWQLGAQGRPLSPNAVDHVLAHMRARGNHPVQYVVSGGTVGQVDILTEDGQDPTVWRVDGANGHMLRVGAWDRPRDELPVARFVLLFHKRLLAGMAGTVFVIASGLLLLANLLIGLKLGWPVKRRWKAVLTPPKTANPTAGWFGWHRALGFWLSPVALLMTATGLGLEVVPILRTVDGSSAALPVGCAHGFDPDAGLSSAQAVDKARRLFIGADIVSVTLPGPMQACHVVQLRQPGEWRRVFGTTRVVVDARTGQILDRRDALAASWPTRIATSLYTLHSGEWAGPAGRLVNLLCGLGLILLMLAGVRLWWLRSKPVRARPRGAGN